MDYTKDSEDYISSTNTHDFVNVEKMLDDKEIYWFSDRTCTSREEIKRYFENAWNLIRDEVYGAVDIKWITVNNNSATCLYTYTWEGFYNNVFTSRSRRATNIFVRNNESVWKLKHEHLSALK